MALNNQKYWLFVIPFLVIGTFTYDWYMRSIGARGIVDLLLSGEGFMQLKEWRMKNLRLPHEPINLSLQGRFEQYQDVLRSHDKRQAALLNKNNAIYDRLIEISGQIETKLNEYLHQDFAGSDGLSDSDEIRQQLGELMELTKLLGDEYRLIKYYSGETQKNLEYVHTQFEKKLKTLIYQEKEITEADLNDVIFAYRALEGKQDEILQILSSHRNRLDSRHDKILSKVEAVMEALNEIPKMDIRAVYAPYYHQDVRGLRYLERIKVNDRKLFELIRTRRTTQQGFVDAISEDIDSNIRLLSENRKIQEQQVREERQNKRWLPVYETRDLRKRERELHERTKEKMQRERDVMRDKGFYR